MLERIIAGEKVVVEEETNGKDALVQSIRDIAEKVAKTDPDQAAVILAKERERDEPPRKQLKV